MPVVRFPSPKQKQFPVEKWTRYIDACESLNRLSKMKKEIDELLESVQEEIEELRVELVDEIRAGGVIERAGRVGK